MSNNKTNDNKNNMNREFEPRTDSDRYTVHLIGIRNQFRHFGIIPYL